MLSRPLVFFFGLARLTMDPIMLFQFCVVVLLVIVLAYSALIYVLVPFYMYLDCALPLPGGDDDGDSYVLRGSFDEMANQNLAAGKPRDGGVSVMFLSTGGGAAAAAGRSQRRSGTAAAAALRSGSRLQDEAVPREVRIELARISVEHAAQLNFLGPGGDIEGAAARLSEDCMPADVVAAEQRPRASRPSEDSTATADASGAGACECLFDCGFRGLFEEVTAHELSRVCRGAELATGTARVAATASPSSQGKQQSTQQQHGRAPLRGPSPTPPAGASAVSPRGALRFYDPMSPPSASDDGGGGGAGRGESFDEGAHSSEDLRWSQWSVGWNEAAAGNGGEGNEWKAGTFNGAVVSALHCKRTGGSDEQQCGGEAALRASEAARASEACLACEENMMGVTWA